MLLREHVRARVAGLVLGEAVEPVADLDHRGVDPRLRVRVLPHRGRRERAEVARGRVPHLLVAGVRAVDRVAPHRLRPEHHVGADRVVPVGLGRERVAGVVRRDLHVALRGPVDEVVGLEDLDVLAVVDLVVAVAVEPVQVRGDHVEGVAVGRPDDERVAQPLVAQLRHERRPPAAEADPVQRAVAGRDPRSAAARRRPALAGEVARGSTAPDPRRAASPSRAPANVLVSVAAPLVIVAVSVSGDVRAPVRRAASPRPSGVIRSGLAAQRDRRRRTRPRGQREVAADVVEPGHGQVGACRARRTARRRTPPAP